MNATATPAPVKIDLDNLRNAIAPVTSDGNVTPTADGAATITLPAWTDAAVFVSEPQASPPEIIKGLLHQGGKCVLGGSSKSRKSWALLDMALSVSTGSKWLNFETTKTPVLFVNFELPTFAIHHRLKAIAEARGVTVTDNLNLWNLRGHSAPYHVIIPLMIERIRERGFGLIILDPSYKLLGESDENSARDIALLLNELERLAVETGAAIVFTAHFAKGNASGKDAQDRMSGSGVFARDPDSIVTFTALQTDDHYAVESILRTLPPQPPFAIRWEYPAFQVAEDMDPGDLKQPKRGNIKAGPTTDQMMGLFKVNPEKPRAALLSAVQMRALFDTRGWDRIAAPAVRDQLVAEGKLAMYHGPHNSKLTGLPAMVEAYQKYLSEQGTVLEQPALPTSSKRKTRR